MIAKDKTTVRVAGETSGSLSSVAKRRMTAGRTSKIYNINKASIVDKKFLVTGVLVATLSTGIGATTLSSAVHADNTDVVDEINITIPSSCSMTGTGMNSHKDDIANGIYKENIGTTTLKAFCNDNAGFAIYATGFTGDEVGGENGNKLVGTTTGIGNIISGIATGPDGSNDISNWAMKLTKLTDSGDTTDTNAFTIDSAANIDNPSQAESGATLAPFTNYHVVPNEYTKVAHKDTSTSMDETTGGVSLTTTYAAYISKTQPAGTYSGKVKYTLVHPATAVPSTSNCEPGHICYDANASTNAGNSSASSSSGSSTGSVEGTMSNQNLQARDWSSCADTDNATYCRDSDRNNVDINTLPYQEGVYVDNIILQASNFKRDGYGFAGWNDKADMSGTNYGPNQTIPVTQDMIDNGFTLYAHWVESTGNLQGWNGCSTLSTNQVIGLTDTRDNNVYAVSKLADGNCWMIENLRLADIDSNNSPITLNSTNTNNPATIFTALSATSNEWCTDGYETCINQNKLNTSNTISFTNNTTGSQASDIYSYGNYYNWYAATAGTRTYNQASGNATGDICPNGWSLPTGNTGGQFSALDSAMGGTGSSQNTSEASNRWRTYPNNFLYTGVWYGSAADGRGIGGSYWSRTASDSISACVLGFNREFVGPGIDSYKFYGFTVRCLAQ